jgi:hypothetical protein
MGPFKVVDMVGKAAVKLVLPRNWSRVHPVFHVSLVKLYKQPTAEHTAALLNRREPKPIGWDEGQPDYAVESIVGHETTVLKGKRGKPSTTLWEYKVRYQGYGPGTWVTAD